MELGNGSRNCGFAADCLTTLRFLIHFAVRLIRAGQLGGFKCAFAPF
jgi:hypothetical protein